MSWMDILKFLVMVGGTMFLSLLFYMTIKAVEDDNGRK